MVSELIQQLSLSQLLLQHQVLQLLVCKGASLPHPSANGGQRQACLVTPCLFGPGGLSTQRQICACNRDAAACCRLSATCAAMTRCRSTTSRQQAQRQSLQRQKRLWPFKQETTPWFRQRAHLGLRDILRGFCGWRSEDRHAFSSPPSPRQPHCPAHPSGTVTSVSFLFWGSSRFAVFSSRGPPSR
ncbi:unnamed protein product [Tetraodon nigroviridis]|uniref:(spotted green pufferfish) hypothetical protein n=1 Tax=Tetraodon nigroviridis TaxID=99883 RepID=Q4RJ62_TETNG|nr:unnamed protein product [Tetraodon nigroviridis]